MALPVTTTGYGFLKKLQLDNVEPAKHSDHFVAPNEYFPQDAKNILKHAPEGAYIGVGGDRLKIGAALCPNTSHIFQLDHNEMVNRFNNITDSLLNIAFNMDENFILRTATDPLNWKLIAGKRKARSEIIEVLGGDHIELFWPSVMNHFSSNPIHWSLKVPYLSKNYFFKNANYLRHEEQFSKIQAIAKANRTGNILVNLTDTKNVRKIVQYLKRRNIKLGVLDLSNFPTSYGIEKGPDITLKVLQEFLPIAQPNSIFLATTSCTQARWCYFGFTFDYIFSKTSAENRGKIIFDRFEKGVTPNKLCVKHLIQN